MAGKVKLTESDFRILTEARDQGDVLAVKARVWPCDRLVRLGFLSRNKGRSRSITPAGRAHLASSAGE